MPSVIRGSDNFDTAGGNAVKAWVNFNGTGTVAIRASFNVSSITDNGTGDYTVNFATALADANYSVASCRGQSGLFNIGVPTDITASTAFGFKLTSRDNSGTFTDQSTMYAAIFR